MSEVEKIAYSELNGGNTSRFLFYLNIIYDFLGMSKLQWRDACAILKESGAYEYSLGDLVLPGIAHCTKKDVLIFNTSTSAHSPLYVVKASTFGASPNTEIPICLAYDLSHYEMLVPETDIDIQKTIELKNKVLHNEYHSTFEELPAFNTQFSKNMNRQSYSSVLKKGIQKK